MPMKRIPALSLLAVWASLTAPCGLAAGHAEDLYLIAPADTLEISVYAETNLIRQLIVLPDGNVSFPLVGDVNVAGKTITQVRAALEQKIREFIPDASVSVIATNLGSLQYYVLGKVANPGTFNMSRPVNVLQALATAGGPTTFAKEDSILIVRSHGKETMHILFNYDEVKKGKKLDQNILLDRGDVVIVP